MKVTALKVNPRRPGRVQVYLDGKLAFSLAKIEALRLKVGQELDSAGVERLQRADAEAEAHERALKLIALRPRSESEVRQRLQQGAAAPEVIEAVLARLKRAGLVDDQAFAQFWVENRATFRPKSQRALRAELKRKGVRDEAVLGQALGAADDAATAYQLAARRAVRLQGLAYDVFRRKLGDFLARRGFDYETVLTVVERVWREQSAGTPEA